MIEKPKKKNIELLIMKGVITELSDKDKELFDWAHGRFRSLYDECNAREEGLGDLALSFVTVEILDE